MTTTAIPRALIGGAITIARLPADTMLRFTGSGTLSTAARGALDRADAGARSVFGTLLRDEALVEEARRIRAAADERQRAVETDAEADELKAEAEAEVRQAREHAKRQRAQAKSRTSRRRQSARKQAEEDRADALEAKEDALTAADESNRLQKAAERAKKERKTNTLQE